jgi:predicted glycoside hydrolase/deacetylase ChbG (UPF0249 family)
MLSKKRQKLIITADDFGKSETANRNILRLAEAGKLDRVSVMSNGIFGPGEIERIKKTGVKLDIHLDLADVPRKERRLKKGVLGRGIIFLLKHIASPGHRKEKVRKRWTSQIEKFRDIFGRRPDGMNSHQHIHLFGRYFFASLGLAGECGIPYFRFAKKDFLGTKTNIRRITRVIWKKDKEKFAKINFERPDYFVSLDWVENFDEFLKNLPDGVTEIACHPERKEEFDLINKYF